MREIESGAHGVDHTAPPLSLTRSKVCRGKGIFSLLLFFSLLSSLRLLQSTVLPNRLYVLLLCFTLLKASPSLSRVRTAGHPRERSLLIPTPCSGPPVISLIPIILNSKLHRCLSLSFSLFLSLFSFLSRVIYRLLSSLSLSLFLSFHLSSFATNGVL